MAAQPYQISFKVCPACGQRAVKSMAVCGRCGRPFNAPPQPPGQPAAPFQAAQQLHAWGGPSPPPFNPAANLINCLTCGAPISPRARMCPHCGEPLMALGLTKSTREVSPTWTFLFGCLYFLVKGWFKAAIAAFVICLFTGLLAWLIIPIFAQKFVDAMEG